MKDYYKILKIHKEASPEEVKKAYRNLAKEFHPDRNPGDTKKGEIFREINIAYEILGNDEKRKEYDGQSGKNNTKSNSQNSSANKSSTANTGFDMNDFEKRFENFFGFSKEGEKAANSNSGQKINTDAMFNSFFKVKK